MSVWLSILTVVTTLAAAMSVAAFAGRRRLRVVRRTVYCTRQKEAADCTLQRDDARGEWVGVVRCSELEARGGILCDGQCLGELNRGIAVISPASRIRLLGREV